MKSWVESSMNREKIIPLLEERKRVLEAAVSGALDRDDAYWRLDRITEEVKDLHEDGKQQSFESPIESAMFNALKDAIDAIFLYADNGKVRIIPQFEVGLYRIDMVVLLRANGREVKIAIECDGYDYHDRTPDLATRDKQRDRILTIAGYTMLRFSGWEINNNVGACVGDVLRCIRTQAAG